ncbi:RHS repeat-associated core domain-containing protein [Pseudomonas fluorescens]|uniref:RHS repeat-associated core domain-containing protein n=1 Tax=Pseudomonas fluorescens TaxID=294 RepID=UPI0012406E40|nr:RHS repeat-associated core domain-containing protein [Pseudomonas fluorescens]VVN46076.1 hypothetical protein PS676_05751 [Pseudomonas fluorescens]
MSTPRESLHYHYDALDRWVWSDVPKWPSVQRFYLMDRLVTEIQGLNHCSTFQQNDHLLGKTCLLEGAVETALLATDHQRSVLHSVEAPTSSFFAYTPYGHRPSDGLLGLPGFNGERPAPLTRHYLLGNGYRAFNPVLMRFNSPDSWSPFGDGGFNAYAYCAGEPINRSDRTGHAFLLKALMMFKEANAGTPSGNFKMLSGAPHILENIAGNLSGKDLASFSKASTISNSVARSIIKKRFGSLSALLGDPLKKIAGYLPGNDLVNFSLASKGTREVARSIQIPFPPVALDGRLPQERIVLLRETALGRAPGRLPGEVLRNEQLLELASSSDYPDAHLFRTEFAFKKTTDLLSSLSRYKKRRHKR